MLISVDDAVIRLKGGDIVALPTETVYGLAGLALNEVAVRKIFTLKGRPATNPLIVHVRGLEQAEKIGEVNELAKIAASTFWPGPLTLVLPKKAVVPDLVTAGNTTVAIRVPKHPVFLEILNRLGQPLAAPSANPSNRTSPTQASHLKELFGNLCPPTVDGGKSEVGLESTVLDLSEDRPVILRPGVLTRKEIQSVLGMEVCLGGKGGNNLQMQEDGGARSPGTNAIHYAPKSPLYLYENLDELFLSKYFSKSDPVIVANEQDLKIIQDLGIHGWSLAPNDCPRMVARNLYGTLIEADTWGKDRIHLVYPTDIEGINRAIWDRLKRAAVQ